MVFRKFYTRPARTRMCHLAEGLISNKPPQSGQLRSRPRSLPPRPRFVSRVRTCLSIRGLLPQLWRP
jgi:hypothetical protein